MKLPEKPAFDWKKEFEKTEQNRKILLDFLTEQDDKLKFLVKKANNNYDYWDKIKYYPLPENVKPEIFWAVVKSVREMIGYKRVFFKEKDYILNLHDKRDVADSIFKYLAAPEIMRKLSFIDRRSSDYFFAAGEENEYSVNSKMEEGIASSQLEGAATTTEIAKEMLRTKTHPKDKSEQMILNNYLAMDFAEKNSSEELSVEIIKNLHKIIVSEIESEGDGGTFRTDQDNIIVADIRDNETIFIPPQAGQIEGMLNALCKYANERDGEYDHPVIKAIIIHFWFAYVHPFKDGNGRTARALFYWFMFKNSYKNFKYFVISRILKSKPAQYKNAYLYTEHDENDLTYFINFNLDAIIEAAEGFEKFLEHKRQENDKAAFLIENDGSLNFRQRGIMKDFIKERKSRNIEYFKNKFDIVYETARKDLLFLVKKGLLSKKKSGKEFIFSLSKSSFIKVSENQAKYGQ